MTLRDGITIRPAGHDDVEAAVAMFATVAEEGLWVGTEAGFDRDARVTAVHDSVDSPDVHMVVAIDEPDGTVVALASARYTRGLGEIGMAVADGWRGHGIGGALIDALVADARHRGAHKVTLGVWPHNARARALYRSRGFQDEGRLVRHYRRADGSLWDAITMGLVLDTTAPGSPHGDEPLVS